MSNKKSDRFEEIMSEIKQLAHEAYELIPRGSFAQQQAKAYWYPHILCAIDTDNDYLGGSMVTMQDTYDKLLNDENDDNNDDEDDEEVEDE